MAHTGAAGNEVHYSASPPLYRNRIFRRSAWGNSDWLLVHDLMKPLEDGGPESLLGSAWIFTHQFAALLASKECSLG
jgi:hypothetical protein